MLVWSNRIINIVADRSSFRSLLLYTASSILYELAVRKYMYYCGYIRVLLLYTYSVLVGFS